MKFSYSFNDKVREYLNPKTGKISADGNFTAFNDNWIAITSEVKELAEKIAEGSGLCAAHLIDGKRKKGDTGFIKAGLVIIDIDNQQDGKTADGEKIKDIQLTVEQALELDVCKKYLSFAYYSPSNTPDWPRFRLVFGLERDIVQPDFYRWFVRTIASRIPGSDKRATQTVNLFYGGKSLTDLICCTDKFIPNSVIDSAVQVFATLPTELGEKGDAADALDFNIDPAGCSLDALLSKNVQNMLNGDPVEDRSLAMAVGLKEIIGWANWCRTNGVPLKEAPLDTSHRLFYSIYEYAPELDGKFNRILNSITNASELLPAAAMAADEPELACWRKVKYADRSLFADACPEKVQEQLKAKKAAPKNSILSIEDFNLTEDSIPTSESKTTTVAEEPMTTATPQTPAQLINLQLNDRALSENDIAEVISGNYGDEFLYDSSLDEFFSYDKDEGIWFLSDEQHIKRRVIKALDTFVKTGILQRYNSGTVNSIFMLLKGRLLRSIKGGRQSIWTSNRGKVAFKNGVLDVSDLEFESGFQRDLYFRSRLGFDYSEDTNCPKFSSWLEWAVGKDNVVIIRAFCRAVLVGYSTGERFLHLIGAGGSGKSTLQQVLIALAGYAGTHTSDLETIETNRFEGHSLIGKRLLLLTDEASFSRRLDTLKKLTSASDTLRAERKYGKEVINFKPELLVSIASNEHISSSDISSGLERRRLTIVMNNVVNASKRRNLISVFPDHIEGEFAPELPNIAAWALAMGHDQMREVLANPTKFAPTLNATNIEALIFNNPIVAWLAECTMYAPNSHTLLGAGALKPNIDEQEKGLYVKNAFSEVYASYCNFAKCNGFRTIAKPRFVDRLRETTNNVLKVPGVQSKFINGKAVIQGLIIKPYDPTTDPRNRGANRLPSPVDFAANPNGWDKAFAEHDPKPSNDDQ